MKSERSSIPSGLSPFAIGAELLFKAVTSCRNALYDRKLLPSYRSSLPVVSVGNVTVGGTGKSPFTQYLVELLRSHRRNPAILSRGYGGTLPGPHLVRLSDSPLSVGDEPLMHTQFFSGNVPVVIARRRSEGAKLLEQSADIRSDVIVLDDGFQHRALQRDLDIVLVDADDCADDRIDGAPWGKGRLIPIGRFREHPVYALRRADLVILVSRREPPIPQALVQYFRDSGFSFPVLRAHIVPGQLRDSSDETILPMEFLRGQSVVALSAIARPEYFRAHLDRFGAKVRAECVYPDHSPFDRKDIESAMSLGYPVIVTAKDMVKIARPSKRSQILVLDVGVAFEDGDEALFQEIIRAWTESLDR